MKTRDFIGVSLFILGISILAGCAAYELAPILFGLTKMQALVLAGVVSSTIGIFVIGADE